MPAPINIELRGLIEARRKADQVVRDLHGTPMLEAMRNATMLVTGTARREAPVDRGPLRASITPEVRVLGDTVEGTVGSNLPYAPYMELGTKPHFAPIDVIQAWVHRKGLAGTYSVKTHRRTGPRDMQASQDRSVAYLI